MKFKEYTINGKEYKFRLTTRGVIGFEKKVGPLLTNIEKMIEAEPMTILIWSSLQNPLNHGVSIDDAMDLLDFMIEEGIIDTAEKRMNFVSELLVDAGFLAKEDLTSMKMETKTKKKK